MIQAAKTKVRGGCTKQNLALMSYLIAGMLIYQLQPPVEYTTMSYGQEASA